MNLMVIEPGLLVAHVVIVGLATIGNVEWWKQLRNGKLRAMPDNKRNRHLLIVSTMFLLIAATMQMPFTPDWITTWWNLITLGNAMVKFGHKALVKVPDAMISKAFGIKPDDVGEGSGR